MPAGVLESTDAAAPGILTLDILCPGIPPRESADGPFEQGGLEAVRHDPIDPLDA
jgi:hypothetical protein